MSDAGLEQMVNDVARRDARAAELEANRIRLIDYLRLKVDEGDWHGVCDAGMDLRDLDNELDGLKF